MGKLIPGSQLDTMSYGPPGRSDTGVKITYYTGLKPYWKTKNRK